MNLPSVEKLGMLSSPGSNVRRRGLPPEAAIT